MIPLTAEDRSPALVAAGEVFAGSDPPPAGSPALPLALAALAGAQAALSPRTSEATMARAVEALGAMLEERGLESARLATAATERRFSPLLAAAERFAEVAGGDGAEVNRALDWLLDAARAVGR